MYRTGRCGWTLNMTSSHCIDVLLSVCSELVARRRWECSVNQGYSGETNSKLCLFRESSATVFSRQGFARKPCFGPSFAFEWKWIFRDLQRLTSCGMSHSKGGTNVPVPWRTITSQRFFWYHAEVQIQWRSPDRPIQCRVCAHLSQEARRLRLNIH